MKAFLTLAVFGTLSATSLSAKPLAVATQSGGFCHLQCPTTSITIHENGAVVAQTEVFVPEHKVSKATIAQVSSKVIAAIKKDIEAAAAVPLVDPDPEGPFCADIPEQSFSIVKHGKMIEIGKQRDCHDFVLESYEASGIITALKGFVFLNNYSQI